MNLRIPKLQALATLALGLLGVAIFMYLMVRFGGPQLRFEDPYEVRATFRDSEGISSKSDVLVRGVKVGEVSDVETRDDTATLTVTIFDRYAPIQRDASARIGEKTLLGEPYVDLDPGSRVAPEIDSGGRIAAGRRLASVELDEALEPLVRGGGEAMRKLLRTFGRGARPDQTANRLGLTVGELRRLVREVRGLTETLRGQETNIAAGVLDSRTVLAELGEREAQVREIVAGGEATLSALAAQRPALERGIAELPRLLATGRVTLREARPLLREARPLLADLRRAAPELTPALRELRPAARSARRVVERLRPFNRAALPLLRRAAPVARAARPLARDLDPALRNLVPSLQYLTDRRRTFVSWFTNTYAIRSNNPDEVGEWARFLLFLEDKTAFGTKCRPPSCRDVYMNPYAPADDQPRLVPYQKGSYPRLMPFR